jgi:polyhydroxyalkanoate synthesis regulator phasin
MSDNINLVLKALKGLSILAQEKLDDYVDISDEESREAADQIIETVKYESGVIFKSIKEKVADILLDEMNFASTYDIEELTKKIQKLEAKVEELSKNAK